LIAAVFVFAFAAAGKSWTRSTRKNKARIKNRLHLPSQPKLEKMLRKSNCSKTKFRFETSGGLSKEVHTRVRINNELGVRQFGRLNFDFNRRSRRSNSPGSHHAPQAAVLRTFLPSASPTIPIPPSSTPPLNQDVRVKSVRILGLQPGDVLEYRVITTTSHHPLAPISGSIIPSIALELCLTKVFEIDVPPSAKRIFKINPETPPHLPSSLDGFSW